MGHRYICIQRIKAMKSCKRCGSYAINEHAHGRAKGHNTDLCDVCYWRNKAEILERELSAANERVKDLEHALSFAIPNGFWLKRR